MFANRTEAGKRLAEALGGRKLTRPVVLALPRGGVPVAIPVADRLDAPLDLLMVRKIGAPGNPELAAGAVVNGPAHQVDFNPGVLRGLGLTPADFDAAVQEKLAEIAARRKLWLAGRAPVDVAGRSVIVVDDGIATGSTMRAALKGLAGKGAAEVILAIPVAPEDTLADLEALADHVLCLETPEHFYAVGAHYADFGQVADDTVTAQMADRRETGQ
ncbi:phosphoribosyltransferase [Maritimibacter fusiformis]|uniref:Phosphoribosyltransferase n=1 Tax=Maritimibacter fusiformis TaxID=2603819 RepID=A0A5D0RKF1_9RHOB|nr:phosphoribosyltransferase family protein [Maritimibacter fusiformis]TYB81982.1 phosphoribosyltransferase [Maritimibacter fusiformis]